MKTRKTAESEHDFDLVLTGFTELTREVVDGLFEAGCDDGTLSIRCGQPYLVFTRTAPTLKDAILSAIQDVRKARVGADVLRVDACDLVSQSDMARKIGRTRQVVSLYVRGERGPGGFPPPAYHLDDGVPLWHWHEAARWFRQNDMIPEDVLRDAEDVAAINNALDLEHRRRRDPRRTREIQQALRAS
jgi:hypothetical protein